MLEELKKLVCEANLELVRRGVVIYTFGNVSGIDRDKGLIVIKPSGAGDDPCGLFLRTHSLHKGTDKGRG